MAKKSISKSRSTFKDVVVPIIATLLFFSLLLSLYFAADKADLIFSHNSFDSYTLQAMAWRKGKTDVGSDHLYLELAIYNEEYYSTHDKDDYEAYREFFGDVGAEIQHREGNKYYVSFPPFPSVPMFLLTFIFGEETPSNLVSILCLTLAFLFCYLICRRYRQGVIVSIGGALFVCLASSELFLAVNNNAGGVWFLAQTMSLFLTSFAFYLVLGNKHINHYFAFALLACAVGCRPFQILYFFPFLFIILYRKREKIIQAVKYCIAPAVIGGLYMVYNYIRFKDPLEFGHNYLPEFRRVPGGQFSTEYISDNLRIGFLQMPFYKADNGELAINKFGFAFWVGSILFLVMVICLIYRLLNRGGNKGDGIAIAGLLICILIHLFSFTLHKTYGGWQFGGRYYADALPAVLVLCCLCMRPYLGDGKKDKTIRLSFYSLALIALAFGIWLNIYGVLKMFY